MKNGCQILDSLIFQCYKSCSSCTNSSSEHLDCSDSICSTEKHQIKQNYCRREMCCSLLEDAIPNYQHYNRQGSCKWHWKVEHCLHVICTVNQAASAWWQGSLTILLKYCYSGALEITRVLWKPCILYLPRSCILKEFLSSEYLAGYDLKCVYSCGP
jgi:hypothetical protein